jgi:DNA-binding NarL/FixJ family response regulator
MEILLELKSRLLCEGLREMISKHLPESVVSDRQVGPVPAQPDIVIFADRKRAAEMATNYPKGKFLFIDNGLSDAELASLLIGHGIHGIISCDQGQSLFIRALQTVYRGEIWLEQKQLQTVLREGSLLQQKDKTKSMSDQDRKIIALITLGQKNSEIATDLCLSEPTIKAHVSRIYKTLNVRNRSQLVTLANESGWGHM